MTRDIRVDLGASVSLRISQNPQTSHVLDSFGIDCDHPCHMALEQACWDLKVDSRQVLQRLQEFLALRRS